MTGSPPLRILLVEDNPGDARLIEEMLDELDSAPDPIDRGTGTDAAPGNQIAERFDSVRTGTPNLTHVTRLSAALDHLTDGTDEPPDVVLLDLNLPDSRGLETLQHLRDRTAELPIVVLTGLLDRQFGVRALNDGAHEYLVKDEINSDVLVRSIHHAIERAAYERQIASQHARLETLNDLNTLVQDVTEAMIRLSTREAVERTVCELLASTDLYAAAAIGDVATEGGELERRAQSGLDGVDDADWPLFGGDDSSSLRAIRNRAVEVVRHEDAEPDDPDADTDTSRALRAIDCRSVAAIPIAYEQTPYGVLTIYSARPDAFDSRERVVVGRLGEFVGHTINSVETKRRLFADTVVELQFESADRDHFFVAASDRLDCTFRLDRVVPSRDEDLLYYVTVDGASGDDVLEVLEETSSVVHDRVLSAEGTGTTFEVRVTGTTAIGTLLDCGAKVTAATAERGTARFTAQVQPQADVRSIVDEMTSAHPSVDFVARREVDDAARDSATSRDAMVGTLTDRQRSTLHAAYHSGFFEWPRGSTGEQVAESLGISPPTYHEHLRHAQQKLMTELLGTDQGTEERRRE